MDILYMYKYRKLIPSNSQHTESDCALECYTVNVLISASLHFDILLLATFSQGLNNWIVLTFWKKNAKFVSGGCFSS